MESLKVWSSLILEFYKCVALCKYPDCIEIRSNPSVAVSNVTKLNWRSGTPGTGANRVKVRKLQPIQTTVVLCS